VLKVLPESRSSTTSSAKIEEKGEEGRKICRGNTISLTLLYIASSG